MPLIEDELVRVNTRVSFVGRSISQEEYLFRLFVCLFSKHQETNSSVHHKM